MNRRSRLAAAALALSLLVTACAEKAPAGRCLYWTEAEYGRHAFWGSCANPPPDASPVIPRDGA